MSRRLSPIANLGEYALMPELPISPLEGEMPGRAEGGVKERHRLRSYLPFHTGSRFSANALNPSILSSDP
jgi:hypothetical protein